MYNKVKDKETEKKEIKSTKPVFLVFFALTLIVVTILYTYLAIALDKKKNGPKEVQPGHEEKYSCKIVDGEYWGKNYEKVDEETYNDQCVKKPQPPITVYSCKIVNGEYWGKNYIKVDEETYKEQCEKIPEVKKYSCQIVDNVYWGMNYEVVDQITYMMQCEGPYTCQKVNGYYFGKNSTIVDEATYKDECEVTPGPIPTPSWKIIFKNVVVDSGSVTLDVPVISSTKTSMEYEVLLTTLGDYYKFDADIVNEGNIDAKIYSIEMDQLSDTQKNYLDYKITYKDGTNIIENDTLLKGETKTITVWLKFRDDITKKEDLPSSDQSLKLEYKINYVEK